MAVKKVVAKPVSVKHPPLSELLKIMEAINLIDYEEYREVFIRFDSPTDGYIWSGYGDTELGYFRDNTEGKSLLKEILNAAEESVGDELYMGGQDIKVSQNNIEAGCFNIDFSEFDEIAKCVAKYRAIAKKK